MKTKTILLIIVIALHAVPAAVAQHLPSGVERPLTGEQRDILARLQATMLWRDSLVDALAGSPSIFPSAAEFAAMEFSALPYYTFDATAFLEDPSPANALACIHPARDKVFFFGKLDGELVMSLEGISRNGAWERGATSRGADYFKKNFSWLPGEMKRAGATSYYILDALGHKRVVLAGDGDPLFFPIPGNYHMNLEQFAATMLSEINRAKQSRAYFERMKTDPEMIKMINENRARLPERARQKSETGSPATNGELPARNSEVEVGNGEVEVGNIKTP
jgi:hypothetical protein